MRRLALVVGLAACGGHDDAPARPAPASSLIEIPLATAPGLSGLAVDDAGALWTVAERAHTAYRITLDAALHPTVTAFAIEGAPEGNDLEAMAALGGDAFAFGTESMREGTATVLVAERRGGALVVARAIDITDAAAGTPIVPNHGVEGACGHGGTILAALESFGTEPRRWAPVVRLVDGAVARTYKLWLTSATGRLSALDCTIDADGTVHAWAIERHFEVSRVLAFTLAPDGPEAITPEVVADLGATLHGDANLEGIARLPDGRLVTVVDNQWKTIQGASRLILLDGFDGRRPRVVR